MSSCLRNKLNAASLLAYKQLNENLEKAHPFSIIFWNFLLACAYCIWDKVYFVRFCQVVMCLWFDMFVISLAQTFDLLDQHRNCLKALSWLNWSFTTAKRNNPQIHPSWFA